MKKRIWGLVVVMSIIFALAVPAYAASTRAIRVVPDIEFDDTTATCTVQITADRLTDRITATMELWRGNTQIDDWNASGSGFLKIDETATVEKNKTYVLTVSYTVNGISQTPVSISRTNS